MANEKGIKRTSVKTKVAHITTVPESLRFLSGSLRGLQSRGCDVFVVSSPGPLLDKFSAEEGVPAFGIVMPRRITPLKDAMTVLRLWRLFRRQRPQIVHAHTPKAGLLGMIAAWLARVPVRIYHIRGLPMMTARGARRTLLTWTETISCALAHRVLAVSRSMRSAAAAERLSSEEKILVPLAGSGNGVSAVTRFNPAGLPGGTREKVRSLHGIPNDALVIGFVGRIVRDKGVADLIEAWRRLAPCFPQAHLLVVGHLEPQDPAPEEVKAALANDSRIHHVGTDWNTPPLYAAMDLVVLPTYREGFPNVPLEAAAMELPVVATQIPGCVDAVEDGVTGTLAPVKDPQRLADAIAQYLQSAELRRRHGKAGRARVLRDFVPERIWEAVWNEYCRLLSQAGLAHRVPAAREGSKSQAA